MQEYVKICLLVSVFAAVREFRPVEPFFTAFLTSPYVGFTRLIVNRDVYPFGTYSCLVLGFFMFLVTDYLCYKPVIVGGSFAGILIYCLMLFDPPLWRVQLSQVCFGLFSASHVAYFSYLYARIEDKRLYQKVTGYARSAILMGKFCNGLFAQLFISLKILEYYHLLFISIVGISITFSISLFFPSVTHSIYFNKKKRQSGYEEGNKMDQKIGITRNSLTSEDTRLDVPQTEMVMKENYSVASHLWHDFKIAFTNHTVIQWSIWLVFAKGCHFLVMTYIQVLWQNASEVEKTVPLMNGAVEAVYTLLSAVASYFVAHMPDNWQKGNDYFLMISCALSSGLLIYLSFSRNLWLMYVAYITYGFIFQSTLTITESQIAQNLQRDSYALVFGFLNFLALGMTSLFTLVVVQGQLFHLDLREQFQLFGAYFAKLSVAILLRKCFLSLCKRKKKETVTSVAEESL